MNDFGSFQLSKVKNMIKLVSSTLMIELAIFLIIVNKLMYKIGSSLWLFSTLFYCFEILAGLKSHHSRL